MSLLKRFLVLSVSVKPLAFALFLVVFSSSLAFAAGKEIKANTSAEDPEYWPNPSDPRFANWMLRFKKEAVDDLGFSAELIDEAFKNVTLNTRVIKLDRKQPHATMTFADYKTRVMPHSRVKQAQRLYKENKVLLDEVAAKYGVQPRFIVALWGMESNFGQNMGGFDIVESLATLAFEGRRAEFFKKELINALKILQNGDVSVGDMKGSWAGAMGQTQFMPSSYLELAVDHNGDGRRDIWGTRADAFASIANYLSRRGWDGETTWGRRVSLPRGFDENLLGRKVKKSLNEWNELDVKNEYGRVLPLKRGDLVGSLVQPGDDDETYLVYENYNTIMKWNRSLYFATAVGLLADKIGNL